MRVTIASGKGGTGKTLLSTNLAWFLADKGRDVAYVDADVEAPNGQLFLRPEEELLERFSVPIPAMVSATCSGCGACQKACQFGAIITLKDRVMVLPELCHGCGACLLTCEEGTLWEVRREIGSIRRGHSGALDCWSGELDVGEARSTPMIEGLLHMVAEDRRAAELIIVDSPPGTACAAVAAVRDADLVLLVTEPTPFGLHDLDLAVQMCRALGRPVAAVINRSDLGNDQVRRWLEREDVPLLAEIPYSSQLAQAYASGALAASVSDLLQKPLEALERAVMGVVR